MITQLQTLQENWDSMSFGEVKITTSEKQHVFDVQVYFNVINPDNVQVELFANGLNEENPTVIKMKRDNKTKGAANDYHFSSSVSSSRPATDFTLRIIPHLPGVSVPLETALILWQH